MKRTPRPALIGALDQGTTSTRFLIFDRAGKIVAAAQREHRQICSRPGWVEHDAEEIWTRTQQVIAAALAQRGLRGRDLAALGIANQRETTVVWERRSGRPLAKAIVWQDTRTAADVAAFVRHGGQDRYRTRTGLPLSTYFSGLKMRWLLRHTPGLRARMAAGEALFGTMDSFLLWKLTGAHLTDVTNASRTQLMNLATLDWDAGILADFGVPRAALPAVSPSSAIYGEARTTAAAGAPIAAVLGDQQAALFGQACFLPGEAKNTYGTGCFLLLNTGERPVRSCAGLATTVAYKLGERPAVYALEGSIAVAGAAVQWLRDNLGLVTASAEIEALARTAADNGGVYFVPAFSGLYAPYWRGDARGTITGLTRYAHKGHLARAALEAAAYRTRDVMAAMERDAGLRLKMLRVDGGMTANALLLQFQADILGRPVIRARCLETTALGAACAAGLGVGFFRGLEEIRSLARGGRTWRPRMPVSRREALYRGWQRAVRCSLRF